MFLSRNNKINVYPCKPQFYCIKVGSILYRHVFVMEEPQQGVSKVCPQHMFPCRNNYQYVWGEKRALSGAMDPNGIGMMAK